MPRQRSSARGHGPLDKLRAPVRSRVDEIFDPESDRSVIKDEPLMSSLAELQTKQALKVLDTYCVNVQRPGSGKINNKAAYLMSLVQSYKLGLTNTTSVGQRLADKLSPNVRKAVDGVFDPVADRAVLEDRALMELLTKVPEEQALIALKKYRATVQHRGRDAINNKCGYLIGFLKQYQDTGALPQGAGTASTSSTAPPSSSSSSSSSRANVSVPAAPSTPSGGGTPHANGSKSSSWRPITFLQPSVRKQLEKMFESGRDRGVLEDVGLMKQLARLGEEQALAALRNYREAAKHRSDINNKSAYLMGILRGYIEGTTPISKAPWEEEGAEAPGAAAGQGQGQDQGRSGSKRGGKGGGGAEDPERANGERANGTGGTPRAETASDRRPSPPLAPKEGPPAPAPPAGLPASPAAQTDAPTAPDTPPADPPHGDGNGVAWSGFNASTIAKGHAQEREAPPSGKAQPSDAQLAPASAPLGFAQGGDEGGGGFFRDGGMDSPDGVYDCSEGFSFVGNGGALHLVDPTQPQPGGGPRDPLGVDPATGFSVSSLLGASPPSGSHGLVGPGLLGGDVLVEGHRMAAMGAPVRFGIGGGSYPQHPGEPHLTDSEGPGGGGMPSVAALADFGPFSRTPGYAGGPGMNGHALEAAGAEPERSESPGSGSGFGSASGSGSGSGSDAGSGSGSGQVSALSPTGDGSAGPTAHASPEWDFLGPMLGMPNPGSAPELLQGNNKTTRGAVTSMLARLNLGKYAPVLAEAEVDMAALRLFGEDDLKDLGIPKGPRIKLLHEVQNLAA